MDDYGSFTSKSSSLSFIPLSKSDSFKLLLNAVKAAYNSDFF